MGKFVLFLLAMASGAAVAAPVVSNVQIAADEAAHEFTVTYDLADGPAIVTLELLSNGIPIGPEQRLCLRGDVNRKVTGSSGTIVWNAGAAAPEKAFADVTAVVSAYDPDDPPDYMAVDLRSGEISYYASTNALPGGIGSDLWRTDMLLLKWIPVKTAANPDGTTFKMLNVRYVKMTKRYYMAVFECTQRQWERVMMKGTPVTTNAERRPSRFNNETCYAARILDSVKHDNIRGTNKGCNWPDSPDVDEGSFMYRLRALTGSDRFDLPTDAQWEYAYRAGTTTTFFWGDTTSGYGRYMRDKNNGHGGSGVPADCDLSQGNPRAGDYEPNPWGIYDLPAGTWEYTLDWWGDVTANSADDPEIDRKGPQRTAGQVQHAARGGCSMDAVSGFMSATGRTAQNTGAQYLGGFHVVYRFDDFDYPAN